MLKKNIYILFFFPPKEISFWGDTSPVIYAAVLYWSLLASEAFMCTRQNSPAKAGAKLKGNCSNSKMISLYHSDFSSWASGLGFSSPQRGRRQLRQRFDWHVNGASGGQFQFPPTGRWGVNGGETVVFEPQFLILFLGVNHSSHLSFLGANCQQMIQNLNNVEFCWVKTSTVSTKQPLVSPSLFSQANFMWNSRLALPDKMHYIYL